MKVFKDLGLTRKMGFFDFLKPAPKEKETLSLNLAELGNWLSEIHKKAQNEVTPQLKELQKELSEVKAKLEKNISTLESAELKNKEIPEKIKHLMEGNRKIYIQKMNLLVEKIQFPENLDENMKFCKEFDQYMTEFDKGITKSHMAMSEFFVNEANAVSTSVRAIDHIVKKQKKLFESGKIEKIKEIEKELKKINFQISQKEEFKSKITDYEKQLKESENEIKKKETELESKIKSEAYEKTLNAIDKKSALENEIKEMEHNLSYDFSEIETALKKYHNASQNRKAENYLNNPLQALYEDKEFEIVSILDSAKNAIEKDEIDLKDKKKDKSLRGIEKLTKSYLENFMQNQAQRSSQLSELNAEIERAEILKEVKIFKEEIEREKYQNREEKFRLEKMKKSTEETSLNFLKEKLEAQIKSDLNENVKIN